MEHSRDGDGRRFWVTCRRGSFVDLHSTEPRKKMLDTCGVPFASQGGGEQGPDMEAKKLFAGRTEMKVLTSPWKMAVDTRENIPWRYESVIIGTGSAARLLQIELIPTTLKSGDYSIVGLENRISIERKSKEDCYGTIGRGRNRFIKELGRLNQLDFAAVIIEAEWSDLIQNPPKRSRVAPSSINGSIIAFQQRFPFVHWWFLPGRYVASKIAYKILDRFYSDNH
jgi:DNA excision repair protein ERCC-4